MFLMAIVCFMPSCGEEEPVYCDVTFWVESDNVEQIIDVHFYSDQTGYDATRQITKYYSGVTPDCWDSGCASFNVREGKYYFQAENDYYLWEGEMDICKECHTMKLYVGKACAKDAKPTGNSELEPAFTFDISKIVNN